MDLAGLVYIKAGTFGGVPAMLAKRGGELALATDERELFRVPLAEAKVEFPWYWLGGGMRVTAAGERYTLGFNRPAKVEGEETLVFRPFDEMWDAGRSSWRSAKEWKAAMRE